MLKKTVIKILVILGILIAIILILFSWYWIKNSYQYEWDLKKTYKAGFVEKDAKLSDGDVIHYAEGPDNGPELLLIHGQCADWTSYVECLPELSKRYHIYTVDCYGHGKSSKDTKKYSAKAIGTDMSWFIKNIIKDKVIVSGHSSGGLIAAWIAANDSEDVSGIVMEDPPYFSCEDNRKEKTWNYNDTTTVCHNYLNQNKESDFTMYYFKNGLQWTFMPGAKQGLVNYAAKYRESHKNSRLVIGFLPQSMMGVYNTIDSYDPRFGETFYDGSFNKNFNHAETLSKIHCPAVLIHASHKISNDGMLQGAMTEEDAKHVLSLVKGCTLRTSKCIHCVHSLDTKNYINIVDELVRNNNLDTKH